MATTIMKSFLLPLLVSFTTMNVVTAVTTYSGFNVTNATVGSTSADTPYMTNYTCSLKSLWTQSRQPSQYPSNPSFFNPIIVAHSSSYSLWKDGSTASLGLNSMVQTGATDRVISEINKAGDVVLGFEEGTDQNVLLLFSQTLPSLQVDKDRSYVTTVTPFSPSPDWFHGFYSFNTIDSASNTFYDSFTIEVFAWDLGTETGDTYTASGSAKSPFDPITEFKDGTIPSSDVFLDSSRTAVLPVASWTCTLQVGDVLVRSSKTSAAATTSHLAAVALATFVGLLLPLVALF